MGGNNLTKQPASGPAPLSKGADLPSKPARPGFWRNFAIIAGSCLGFIALIALAVGILGSQGKLSGPPGQVNEEPAWSPDGSQIAFSSNRRGNYDIYVMNSDGSQLRQLTSDPFASLYFIPGNAGDYTPAWSPDGKKLAFVSGRNDSASSFVDTDIYIMNSDGKNVVRWQGSLENSADNYPEWSPDGSCIVYSSSPYPDVVGTGASDIFMASANSANEAKITNLTMGETINSDPSWSPDGNRIAFASFQDESWHIYAMNKNGSDFVQLTNGLDSEYSPAWSPDGTHIAYTAVLGGKADIFVMNPDGTNITKLTQGSAISFLPAWSPDSRRIAFVSDQGGINQVNNIYVMDADGSNVIQLTK